MPKLDKGTLALTFKFDCDRFLRFRLASDQERNTLDLSADTYKRPGIELIKAAGRRWEMDKYQDLIDTSGSNKIIFKEEDRIDPLLGRKPFKKIENLFKILHEAQPPYVIIEAEFVVPTNITLGLQKAYDKYGLEQVKVRPDILWIRPGGTGAPLIGMPETKPDFEIHIVDVKMAAEPSLRHFTEVTYYALALATAIEQEGLAGRYAVSAEGMIWPGNHDVNGFRKLVQSHLIQGSVDPITDALIDTLIPVPYEVYEVHVKQFFEERLLRVLETDINATSWHVGPKCQLCDYVRFCLQKASDCDHLSRLAWLTKGQADLLRANNINTTADLTKAVMIKDHRWGSVIESSHQLRADGLALATRGRSLNEGIPIPIEGRKSSMIPAWSDQSIFITIHFDPGSGITFAMGATRLFFPPNRNQGDPPITDEKIFIVDRVDAMNPETELERLKEFASVVSEWLEQVSTINKGLPARQQLSSHFYFWDLLEIRQLKRMFERHMQNPAIVNIIEILIRFFPPDNLLPDPDAFKSQPGTVVKEVLRMLLALPLPHDYSLFESANNLSSKTKVDIKPYKFGLTFGFWTPMSDQIPFERAYELWQDKIFLRHFNDQYPNDQSKWRRYTRDELYNGIKIATKMHLNALQHIVLRLHENYRDLLIMKKTGFSSALSTQASVPEAARSLITFEKLNVACHEIENRNIRSLPVDEREARFFSIRGLKQKSQPETDQIISEILLANPRYMHDRLYVFDFTPTSRDSRIREGEFNLAISNEETCLDLDESWRYFLGLSFLDAQNLLVSRGLGQTPESVIWIISKKKSLGNLLQMEVIRLEAMKATPYIVLKPCDQKLFQLAIDIGIIDLSSTLVLDPVFRDYSSDRLEQALKTIGGQPAPIRRTRRRR